VLVEAEQRLARGVVGADMAGGEIGEQLAARVFALGNG